MNAIKLKKLRNNPRKCVLDNIKEFNKRKKSCVFIKSINNSFINSVIVAISLHFKDQLKLFNISANALNKQSVKSFKRIKEQLKINGCKNGKVVEWIAYFKSIGIDIIIFQGNKHFKIFGDVKDYTQNNQIHLVRYKNDCKSSKKKFKYDVLQNPSGYFQKGFMCKICFKFSKSKVVHCCRYACYMCKSLKRHDREDRLKRSKCTICNRYFYGVSCKKLHVRNKVCKRKKCCEKCQSVYVVKGTKQHYCRTENYCNTCKIVHPPNRHFIKGEIEVPDPTTSFLVFDFETFPCGDKKVETAYFCSTRLYTLTYTSELIGENANGTQKIKHEVNDNYTFVEKNFEGLNCSKEFYEYIVSGEIPLKTICIAHNGQSFDFYFLLRHFFKCKDYQPEVIINGTKLMQMKFEELGLKFVDSLNFIPFALRKFPDLFGFPDRKTFFPHNFVNEDTLAYNGDIPKIWEYGIKPNDLKDFEEFYIEEQEQLRVNNSKWCLMDVARDYCIQDVNVLFKGIFSYLKTFMKVTNGIDPFA
jgi:DNA polymerase type B, organellar and viral